MSSDTSNMPMETDQPAQLKRALLSLNKMRSHLEAVEFAKAEPIAIIGMSCRFPGGADDPEAFWRLLHHGSDVITEIPPERWDVEAYYDPDPEAQGKMYTRSGGFLQGIDYFDAGFFGIAPREALSMDPHQRILLELVWEALERAGQAPKALFGSQTGIFVSVGATDYLQLQKQKQDPTLVDAYFGMGSAPSVAAGRLSYILGFHGPCMAVDTACSSSLVTVHLACQALRSGECNMAVVGAANLVISPEGAIYFSRLRALAPDGRCKTFDARADGYVRGEGCGVVVLKRLSDAQAAGDPILALIRGSAVNQDGRSNGLTAPNGQAQEAVIRQALAAARIKPEQIDYVEAHGTGTSLGDPIEMRALGEVLSKGRPADKPFRVGSVKTNIGHTEAAAGMAGLIKTVLALQYEEIPAHLHLKERNPYIPWNDIAVTVPTENSPWPSRSESRRCAGVSAFGVSGTNAHLILEEAPAKAIHEEKMLQEELVKPAYLLPLSARTPLALRALAGSYERWLREHHEIPLDAIAVKASLSRNHHEHRLALIGRTYGELTRHLQVFLQGNLPPGASLGKAIPGLSREIVFVCSGQGSQWEGMGQRLLEQEPVFRQQMERCEQALRAHVDWSLLEVLRRGEPWQDIALIQPVLFSLQVSLAALWRGWGVEPGAVVGHSLGEVAAACIAGSLSLEEGARIICERSRLLRRVSNGGAMLLVEQSQEQAQAWVRGREKQVAVAVSNSARATVLAGERAALAEIEQEVQRQGIFCRWLKVDVAAHSPQVEGLREELAEALRGLVPAAGEVAFYSTVRGQRLRGEELDAAYWVSNLREPVQFGRTVQGLLSEGYDTFVELSPHPLLTSSIEETIAMHIRRHGTGTPNIDDDHTYVVIGSLRRGEEEQATLLQSLGTLYVHGMLEDWTKLYRQKTQHVDLPIYPFQRERFWIDTGTEISGQSERHEMGKTPPLWHSTRRNVVQDSFLRHPLFNLHMASSLQPGTAYWEGVLNSDYIPYLLDHRVQGKVVVPAALYIEGILKATTERYPDMLPVLEQMHFIQMLTLSTDRQEGAESTVNARRLQIVFETLSSDTARFQCLSTVAGDSIISSSDDHNWTLHAEGNVRLSRRDMSASADQDLEKIRACCHEEVAVAEYYAALEAHGLEYGPAFRGIERLWRHDGEALASIRMPQSLDANADLYLIHPALLDSCLQVIGAATPKEVDSTIVGGHRTRDGAIASYIPASAGQVIFFRKPSRGEQLWCHALIQRPDTEGTEQERTQAGFNADIHVMNEAGEIILSIQHLRLQRFADEQDAEAIAHEHKEWHDWLYEVRWLPYDLPEPSPELAAGGTWFFFVENGNDLLLEHLRTRWEERGAHCIVIRPGSSYRPLAPRQFQLNLLNAGEISTLLKDVQALQGPPCRGIVYVCGQVDQGYPEDVVSAVEIGSTSILHLVQALARTGYRDAPRLWLVTCGVHMINTAEQGENGSVGKASLAQSSVEGLGRSISCEFPELRCACVDMSISVEQESRGESQVPAVVAPEVASLERLCWSNTGENQLALRGHHCYTARLVRWNIEGQNILTPAGERPFRLETTTPGSLDDLTLRAFSPLPLAHGEVEIEIAAASLNFSDVLQAMGIYPGQGPGAIIFGSECSGRITAIGEGVSGLNIGDDVVAIAAGSIGTCVKTLAEYVVHKPEHLSFVDAASVPAVFMTAYYALHDLARLAPGECILIHAASGGVGLAAVQLAQKRGAQIFATAGTPAKREFLHALGIQHVMDSRSLTFAAEIMEITHGQGVDVVLNSLTGEALTKSVAVLAPYGRFLEIGKKDIYQNHALELYPFRKNLAYFAIDMAAMALERPALYLSLLRKVMEQFNKKAWQTLPVRNFPVGEVAEAFRCMARASHIGKIVISLQDTQGVPVAMPVATMAPIYAQATYLLTGGLGGLGRTVARWMVEQGARHIVLIGRRGVSLPEEQEALKAMAEQGAQVVVRQADVTQRSQMAAILAEIERTMPPLRGVLHCAAVLDDGVMLRLNQERMQRVLAPKVIGAWNLHCLTEKHSLDFFVLFSSAASLLGSPAQANYSAANAFLDALAHYRRARHLPALSINWGPWAEVGLAATLADRGEKMAFRGMTSMTPQQGTGILGQLLNTSAIQVGVVSLNFRQWSQSHSANEFPFLSHLIKQSSAENTRKRGGVFRDTLFTAVPEQRMALLEIHVREQIASVLRLAFSDIEATTALGNLGFDSLMALELRNRLEASLGLTLSATLIWSHRTVGALVRHLAQKMELPLDLAASRQMLSSVQREDALPDSDTAEIKNLSQDAAKELLLAELDVLAAEMEFLECTDGGQK